MGTEEEIDKVLNQFAKDNIYKKQKQQLESIITSREDNACRLLTKLMQEIIYRSIDVAEQFPSNSTDVFFSEFYRTTARLMGLFIRASHENVDKIYKKHLGKDFNVLKRIIRDALEKNGSGKV